MATREAVEARYVISGVGRVFTVSLRPNVGVVGDLIAQQAPMRPFVRLPTEEPRVTPLRWRRRPLAVSNEAATTKAEALRALRALPSEARNGNQLKERTRLQCLGGP